MTTIEAPAPVAPARPRRPAAAPVEPRLDVRSVGFRYAGSDDAVLHDVTLRARPGQAIGVLGPNGAGKSTLLGTVAGALDGTVAGEVLIDGRRSFAPDSIGFATQDTALYPALTVRENLQHLARLLLGRARAGSAVDRAIEEFGLEGIVDVPAHQLSGGQRRLAHIAVSFVHQPPVRLLDEPTAALDFERRARLLELVTEWRSAGVAVVVTAHYPEDIEALCTDLVVIKDGYSVDLGPMAGFLASRSPRIRVRTALNGAGSGDEATVELPDRSLRTVLAELEQLVRVEGDRTVLTLELLSGSLRSQLEDDPDFRAYVADGNADA